MKDPRREFCHQLSLQLAKGVADFDARILARKSGVPVSSAARWLRCVLFVPQTTYIARWSWDSWFDNLPVPPSQEVTLLLLVAATGATAAPPKQKDWAKHDGDMQELREQLTVEYKKAVKRDPKASFNSVAFTFVQKLAAAKGVWLSDGRGTKTHTPGLTRGGAT